MKTETKCRVAACAAGFALPRYADLPQMGLYLDQTVQYVNSYFRTFCGVELTSSMVSNYVKKGILSHPVRKKYARDQIASLMYIAVSKRCSQWKTSMPYSKCSGRTVPPGQLTTTSATRWRTACRLYSAAPGRSATLPWMPQMKSCFSAARSLQRQTKCTWTAASTPCGRRKISGIPFCPIWHETAKRETVLILPPVFVILQFGLRLYRT